MYNELITTVASDAIQIIFTLLVLIISPFIVKLVANINKKLGINADEAEFISSTSQLETIVIKAVDVVNQTFVDDLKAQDKFDEESMKIAMSKAILVVKSLMTDTLTKYVQNLYGDTDKLLESLIEACIKSNKDNRKDAINSVLLETVDVIKDTTKDAMSEINDKLSDKLEEVSATIDTSISDKVEELKKAVIKPATKKATKSTTAKTTEK